jgi:hypothetical protein
MMAAAAVVMTVALVWGCGGNEGGGLEVEATGFELEDPELLAEQLLEHFRATTSLENLSVEVEGTSSAPAGGIRVMPGLSFSYRSAQGGGSFTVRLEQRGDLWVADRHEVEMHEQRFAK